jgi:hypothetical protein
MIAHGGDVRGFHMRFSFYPQDDAAIVVLCNVGGVPTWAVAENLQAILFGDRSRYPRPPSPAPMKPKELEALAGSYALAPDERIELRVEGEALVLTAVGLETTRLLHRPGYLPPGTPPPSTPKPELVERAREITEAVAAGDPEPLRAAMLPNIPRSWPDRMISDIWPRHAKPWGELRGIRVVGGLAQRGTSTVLLALDHTKESARLKIVFQGEQLSIFDLDGPESLASVRCVAGPDDELAGFAWMGAQPDPIELLRDRRKRVQALRIGDGSGKLEYERVE